MGSATGPSRIVLPQWRRESTVYVVGVDAMTLDVIGPLSESGFLPHFAFLIAEGCHGLLGTIYPNNSGLIWTTIATGHHYRDHGIDALGYYRLSGLHVSRRTTRKLNRIGLKVILDGLRSSGLMTKHTFDARHVRVKAFWDILSEAGSRIGVVNWLNTWPAYPVNGFLASDRLQPWRPAQLGIEEPKEDHLTFPQALVEDLRPLLVPPDEVPLEVVRRYVRMPQDELVALLGRKFSKWDVGTELKYSVSSDLSAWQVFEYCLDAFAPLNIAVVFFWAMDKIQHAAFRYMQLAQDMNVTEGEREKFGVVVPESYRFIDSVIGKIMSRMGPQDTLLVLSDHGFAYEEKRGTYGHKRSRPPGVFFAYGKEFIRGCRIEGATVYDVTPIVLRVCGFPPAQDMKGRCPEEVLRREFRCEHPLLAPVPSYGARFCGRSDRT